MEAQELNARVWPNVSPNVRANVRSNLAGAAGGQANKALIKQTTPGEC